MKKNMIALAVAGALVAPVAMADVTVSGGLQAELVQIGGAGSQPNGLYAADAFQAGKENAGNYGFLKFSTAEDLGGGVKALASYSLNANVGDSSKAGLDTRDAYVGLSTGYGTVLAGTLATPYKSSTAGWDPMLATSFQARGNNGMSILHNGYASNALAYANSFAGGMVSVVAAVVLDETGKDSVNSWTTGSTVAGDKTNSKNATSFSVNIAPMSGLDVAVAYINVSKFGDASNLGVGIANVQAPDKASATKVGVKYAAGPFTVAYQHEMLDKGLTAANILTYAITSTMVSDKGSVDYVTASFKVDDANTISASFGKTSKKVGGYGTVANDGDVGSGSNKGDLLVINTDKDPTYMAIDFNHAFSKNMSAYVGYRVSDSGNATYAALDPVTGTVNGADLTGTATKETAIGAGLRVNF